MKKKILSILFFALAVPLGLMAQETQLLNNGGFTSTAAADLTQYRVGVNTESGSQAFPTNLIKSGVGRSGNGLEISVPSFMSSNSEYYDRIYVTPQHTWTLGGRFTFQFYTKAGTGIDIGYMLTDGIGKTANNIIDNNIKKQNFSVTGGWTCHRMTGTVTQAMLDAGMKTITITIRNKGTAKVTLYIDDFSWIALPPLTLDRDGVTYQLNTNLTATAIGYYYDIASMVSVAIPETLSGPDGNDYTVTAIGDNAFAGCTNLWTVALPGTIESIGDRAFAGLPITNFYIHASIPPTITSTSFSIDDRYNYGTQYIHVFPEVLSSYQNADVWKDYETLEFSDFTGGRYVLGDDYTAQAQNGGDSGQTLDFSSGKINVFDGYQTQEYTITGIVPWGFTGSQVTSVKLSPYATTVAEGAFYGCTSLTSVTIPESVTSIGELAFHNCPSLRTVTCLATTPPALAGETNPFSPVVNATLIVPAGTKADYEAATYWKDFWKIVEMIDLQYSYDNENMTATVIRANYAGIITVPPTTTYEGQEYTVTAIGDRAFLNCTNLTGITLPQSITTIDGRAFMNCTGLTSIRLPENLSDIGLRAFYGCTGLTSLTIPETVNSIGEDAFRECTGLTFILYPSTASSIGNGIFAGCTGLTWVDLSGATSIVPTAFRGCTGLTYIYIPETINSIGENAFLGCLGVTEITIPASVSSIGEGAFAECSGLTSITVSDDNPNYDSRGGCNAIIHTSTNTLVAGCVNTVIPTDVTSIGYKAFSRCSGLTSITIPEGVVSLGIGCFSNCADLSSVALPQSLTSIDRLAFSDCVSLTDITLPEQLDTLGYGVFGFCDNLKTVRCEATTPPRIDEKAFQNVADATLYVPFGTKAAYEAAPYWQNFGQILESGVDATIDGIHYSLNPRSGQAIVLAGDYSGDITIPATVTYEGEEYTVKEIASGAFMSRDITSVTFPTTLTAIHGWSFVSCNSLPEVTLPEGITEIESGTFGWCQNLTTATIPSTVTNIGDQVFIYCTQLASVYCNATTPPAFSASAFQNIASDATLYVPAGTKADYEAAGYGDYFAQIVEIANVAPGDVNGDGQVNVVDFLSTANYILGNTPEVFIVKAANVVEDLNDDGTPKINVTDFLGIANLILSSEETAGANSTAIDMEEAPRRAAGATPADIDAMDNVMYVEPVTAAPGTQQTLSIRMKNTSDHIAGYEFLLRLPEGITVATDADGLAMAELSEERTTKRNTDHFLTNLRSDGLKVLCGTMQQDPATGKLYAFSGHDGEVARVTVNIPADYAEGEYPVTLVNAVMAGNNESHTTAVSTAHIAIRFDTPTGISLTTDTSVTDDQSGYYTLDGIKLDSKPIKKGMYIHNGKKEVVK